MNTATTSTSGTFTVVEHPRIFRPIGRIEINGRDFEFVGGFFETHGNFIATFKPVADATLKAAGVSDE